jgi:DNA (cytosine-5)-methyltransferase 1
MDALKPKTDLGLTVVDLFCGAGGLSSGFQKAGFTIVKAIDHHAAAVETYKHNLGDHVTKLEITEELKLLSSTVIVGGPPCQGFSSAGLRRAGDKRNTLVSVLARLVVTHRPLAFVFENVEGFLTGENGARVFDLLVPLVSAGYRIHLRKINVANFGVPQHRKRVLAIGGLGWEPTFPMPTHTAYGAPGAGLAAKDLPLCPSLSDALCGLPSPEEKAPGRPQGHFNAKLKEDDLPRIRSLKQGQTMKELPPELWHESYRKRAFRRVQDGTPTENRGGAPSGIRRLKGDEPCKAITSGAKSEFLHYSEDRYLTLRECARIQTFPDTFEFFGTIAEQSILIGNAVPPSFATILASHLKDEILGAKPDSRAGALLSFVPTLSAGMSPALERITAQVRTTFSKKALHMEQARFIWD